MSNYSHTQRGWIHWMVYACAASMFAVAFALNAGPAFQYAMIAAGVICLLLAMCFHHLTVTDCGDQLEVRFGPLAIFGTTIRFADIQDVNVARTRWIDGLGIHWAPGHGWTYNISGRDCVKITRTSGRVLWVGTDDAEALAASITARLEGATARTTGAQ